MKVTVATPLPSGIVGRMKALTIKQPWAELIINGLKDVENRSRLTHFRGRFAVHAGLRRADFEDLAWMRCPKGSGSRSNEHGSATRIRVG